MYEMINITFLKTLIWINIELKETKIAAKNNVTGTPIA